MPETKFVSNPFQDRPLSSHWSEYTEEPIDVPAAPSSAAAPNPVVYGPSRPGSGPSKFGFSLPKFKAPSVPPFNLPAIPPSVGHRAGLTAAYGFGWIAASQVAAKAGLVWALQPSVVLAILAIAVLALGQQKDQILDSLDPETASTAIAIGDARFKIRRLQTVQRHLVLTAVAYIASLFLL